MAVDERRSLADQSVHVGSFHVVESQFFDRVKALLIRDDENDMGTFVGHVGVGCTKKEDVSGNAGNMEAESLALWRRNANRRTEKTRPTVSDPLESLNAKMLDYLCARLRLG